MARRKTIALNEDEKNRLDEYKETEHEEGVPYGVVIMAILDEVEG